MGQFLGPPGAIGIASRGLFGFAAPGGFQWTARNGGTGGFLSGVAVGPVHHVVAVAANRDATVSLDSGTTWTVVPGATVDGMSSLDFGNGNFIAATNAGSIARSTDGGLTWTEIPALSSNGVAIAYGGGQWVTMSNLDASITPNYAVSVDDGLTWVTPNTLINAGWGENGVTWDGAQFVATGGQESTGLITINTSPDGVTWTEIPVPGLVQVPHHVAFGAGLYMLPNLDQASVRVAATPAGLATAADIPIVFTGGDTGVLSVAFNGTLWVAGGAGGSVATSSNTTTWSNEVLNGFAWDIAAEPSTGIFIAVGVGGEISTRP
jgi:hypothetical protein